MAQASQYACLPLTGNFLLQRLQALSGLRLNTASSAGSSGNTAFWNHLHKELSAKAMVDI
jgi:hypothetical protein